MHRVLSLRCWCPHAKWLTHLDWFWIFKFFKYFSFRIRWSWKMYYLWVKSFPFLSKECKGKTVKTLPRDFINDKKQNFKLEYIEFSFKIASPANNNTNNLWWNTSVRFNSVWQWWFFHLCRFFNVCSKFNWRWSDTIIKYAASVLVRKFTSWRHICETLLEFI